MEEENVIKEEKKLVFAKKEVWISGVIGLLLGAIIMFLLYITPKVSMESLTCDEYYFLLFLHYKLQIYFLLVYNYEDITYI